MDDETIKANDNKSLPLRTVCLLVPKCGSSSTGYIRSTFILKRVYNLEKKLCTEYIYKMIYCNYSQMGQFTDINR